MRDTARSACLVAVLLLLATVPFAPLSAQAAPADTPFTAVLAPGVRYDPAIPTLKQVAGHDFDDALTTPEQIAAYMHALANAAPERTRLVVYGHTYEGRELDLLVIGSRENMARLDSIQAGLHRLAYPEGLDDAAGNRLVSQLPVVVAALHEVHGNEISGAGAGMAEAYHLLAAQNDPRVAKILAQELVLIDPLQNPDGRGRFVEGYRQARSFPADPDPAGAGHDEPWPGGRTNHYLFDLNRDWFALTQPESRGKVRALLEYQPQVVADLHEMGGNSTYYFPPAAIPGNPWVTQRQWHWYDVLGRAMADAFDTRGFAYFTREEFDAFYPGYGVSWPTAQGAMGMTFEQASARGLVLRRSDGTLLTYGDGILHHFTAALATMEASADNREAILRDFLAFHRSAVQMGRDAGPAAWVLYSDRDPALAARLARLLVRNGVEVRRADAPVRVNGQTLPAGQTYIVDGGQPAARMAHNILDATTHMPEDFLKRQVERGKQRLRYEIYDITAWSLPLLWDVDAIRSDRPVAVASTPVTDGYAASGDDIALTASSAATPSSSASPAAVAAATQAATLPAARVGYLMPWNSAAAAAVVDALRQGLRVRVLDGATTIAGRRFPVGTALFRSAENAADLPHRLAVIAARHGAEAVPVQAGFKDSGISLGSNDVRAFVQPRVLLVWDSPAQSGSAGWARYVLEQRYGQPVTAVRADAVARTDLADYDVIILPSGNYGGVFGDATVTALRQWLRFGGTLITMAESSRWAARVGLLATSTELRGGAPEFGPGTGNAARTPAQPMKQPIDLLQAITPDGELPEQTPGAIVNMVLDTTSWLAAGTDGQIGVMVDGRRIFTPLKLDEGSNIGVYADVDHLVAGGIVWQDARPQLAHKAFLMLQPMGRAGKLIAFAEDPDYRGYAEATELLLVNAVLMGSAR